MSVKNLHCAALIHLLTQWMSCLNILVIAPGWFAQVLSYWGHLETARFGARAEEKNSMSCVITASAPTNDHAQIRYCTLWVCKQQDNAMHSRYITVFHHLSRISR